MLTLAALDSVAAGGWAILQPEKVFAALEVTPPQDRFLLPVLGALLLGQGLCLLGALLRPREWGGLVWVPLLGRLIFVGLWLWLLGAGRLPEPRAYLLLAHEVLWIPGFAVFLAMQWLAAATTADQREDAMSRFAFALTLAVTLPTASFAADQWIVVTAPAFRGAVEPLCEQRKAQGMTVKVVETTDILKPEEVKAGDAQKLREHVNKLCGDHKGTSYVLLVGAVEAGKHDDAAKIVLPPLSGTVGRMKGQPSDNGYGCLDDGRTPTVAVGRFPARTVEEAKAMVQKTLDLERDTKPGEWKRRLTVLAGVPAYNPVVDRLVEGLALNRFDRIDPSWMGKAIYHNPQSRFCVPDNQLQKTSLKYVEEGQAFTVYLGHSYAGGLWGGEAHYLDRDDWAKLKIARGRGVFMTFGCNGCQLKGEDGEGYGVAAIRNPSGPAAVTGSHGICFAAMVQLAADGLFESTFTGKPPERLGATWLAMKNGLAKGKIDALTYATLDRVDGDPKIPQETQRQEHLEMFVLLGDPALKLPSIAADVKLKTDGKPAPGEALTITGTLPERLQGAKVRLTLERPVSSVPPDLEPLPKNEPAAKTDRIMLANHERANRFALATGEVTAKDGSIEWKVDLPAKLPYPRLVVRAYATTERDEGLGVLVLEIKK